MHCPSHRAVCARSRMLFAVATAMQAEAATARDRRPVAHWHALARTGKNESSIDCGAGACSGRRRRQTGMPAFQLEAFAPGHPTALMHSATQGTSHLRLRQSDKPWLPMPPGLPDPDHPGRCLEDRCPDVSGSFVDEETASTVRPVSAGAGSGRLQPSPPGRGQDRTADPTPSTDDPGLAADTAPRPGRQPGHGPVGAIAQRPRRLQLI